jgi:CheY-like chemotaxis protein
MAGTVLVVDDSPTIRKVVVQQLKARGYDAVTATDGAMALGILQRESIDVVLMDFVLPGINGIQVCRALKANPATSHIPVVLMSAKADKIRRQALQQSGASDAITKPFDPLALHAVIEQALLRPRREARSEAPESASEHALDLARVENAPNAETRDREIASLFAKSVSRLLLPKFAATGVPSDPAALESALLESLTPDNLKAFAGLLGLLHSRRDSTAVLAGDLGFISIAEVMQMLELQRQTGVLKITYGDQEIALFFGEGRIDMAKSSNLPASFLLGRFLVEDTVVDRKRLETLLNEPDAASRLLGETLVERNLANEHQIRDALRRQTSELVYEAVRWKNGRFMFHVGQSSPEATLAHLGLAPGALLMEGFRRVDEWQLIEGSFQFDDVLSPDRVAIERLGDRSDLTAQEELVLAAVNGQRSVREIVDEVDASTFDVCKSLHQFLNSGLIRRKSA